MDARQRLKQDLETAQGKRGFFSSYDQQKELMFWLAWELYRDYEGNESIAQCLKEAYEFIDMYREQVFDYKTRIYFRQD